ncbi:MAG: phosphatase PAP2 family protein [Ruminococcus sp.]|nr:phosphatase PAP2 family protein [Ruminococcus sp.]
MTEQSFLKIQSYFKTHDTSFKILKFVYKYLPWTVHLGYPALLAFLFFQLYAGKCGVQDFTKAVAIPLLTLIIATILRKLINAPRPYEKYSFSPLAHKDTRGQSFPSRHSASVFIISMTFLYFNPFLGAVCFFIGIIMVSTRVLVGVHFIKDIVAGALLSTAMGMLFYINFI